MEEKIETHNYLESGNIFFKQKKYEKACGEYQKATKIDPEYAESYYMWGLALAAQGKYKEAIKKYNQAIKIDRKYAESYNSWGLALAAQGKYKEAIKKYNQAININSKYAEFYDNLGLALATQRKYEEAIKMYNKAINQDHRYVCAYNNWGLALAAQGKYEEAIKKYNKATNINSKYAESYYRWGLALAAQGKYKEAIKKYNKATNKDPEYAEYYNRWGLALAAQGKYKEAIKKYNQAININSNYAEYYNNWGNVLTDQKKYEEAIEKYRRALDINHNYAYAYHNTAYILWRLGKYDAAGKNWERACNAYEQLVKTSNDPDNFQYFGSVLHFLVKLDKAERIYKIGLSLDQNHIGILTGLVNLYLEKDEHFDERTADSLNKYRRRVEGLIKEKLKKTEDASTFLQLGELYIALEEYEEAEKNLKNAFKALERDRVLNALKRDSTSSRPYADLGILYARSEDFKKAACYFGKALRQDPEDLTIWSNLAESFLRDERLEKAEKEYRNILTIAPNHLESQIGLGEVYTAMGEAGYDDMYEEAIDCFTKAINIAQSEKSSRRLKKKELAAMFYSKGYAEVKLYESLPIIEKDETWLNKALDDFKISKNENHLATRAFRKLKKRLSYIYPLKLMEKVGPLIISILSLIVFALSQTSFFLKYPKEMNDIGYYVLVTFGSLIFMVAGISMPRLLKLKVAGIELEKTTVEQKTMEVLGISKRPVYMITSTRAYPRRCE